MIELTTLHEALIGEIRDLYGAEKQLLKALVRVAPAVRTAGVRDAVGLLITDTGNQLWRLEEIFSLLGEEISSRRCLAMARILDSRAASYAAGPAHATLDAQVTSVAQRALHFLSAVHSTAAARARALGHDEVGILLAESTAEATALGRRLTTLALPLPVMPIASVSARA